MEKSENPEMMNITATRFGKSFIPGEEKKQKRKTFASIVLFLICAVVIVSIVTIILENVIRCYVVAGQEETWAASIASYWGGIIGGVVSGILSFLGVFYTIRYYKESDAQKERAAVQPFLMVELGRDSKSETRNGFGLGERTDDKEKQKTINVAIRNIGNGFAKTLVIHTGINAGGIAFSKVINVGDSVYTYFVVNKENIFDGLSFGLQYIDSMTNEYIQEYELREEHGSIIIDCGYPQLVEQ